MRPGEANKAKGAEQAAEPPSSVTPRAARLTRARLFVRKAASASCTPPGPRQATAGVGPSSPPFPSRPPPPPHPPVRHVRGHDEVVLHDEGRLLGVHDEPLDHLTQVTQRNNIAKGKWPRQGRAWEGGGWSRGGEG